MATCTQCGKEVSVFDRDVFTGACAECRKIGARPATLGLGTLLLIAILVWVAMSSGVKEVRNSVAELGREIAGLRTIVDQQTAEIRALRSAVGPSQRAR